jgi:deoxyribodipyrimidine photo-lyase
MTPSKPITICFFRNILRVHDNQSLYHALQDVKKEGGNLLPVVCLDPRMMDLSKLNNKTQSEFQPPKTWHFDLERCAAFRTRFIIESVQALKQQLLKHESDLLILFGEPEVVFADLKNYLAKHHFTLNSIHTHKEVSILVNFF